MSGVVIRFVMRGYDANGQIVVNLGSCEREDQVMQLAKKHRDNPHRAKVDRWELSEVHTREVTP
jgi:hypothetical protein